VIGGFASGAFAHPADESSGGLVAGICHPLTGLDHLIATLAVGLLAARLGGKSFWLLSALFLGGIAAGGAFALSTHVSATAGIVDQLIATSVIVFGTLLIADGRLHQRFATLLVPLFAAFHGFAHLAERRGEAFDYGIGLLSASAAILIVGLFCGSILNRHFGVTRWRWAGSAVAVIGAILFFMNL
jgi:urease accessory protein